MVYGVTAGKQVNKAPCEEATMIPRYLGGAFFFLTWCPTFKIGCLISCLVQVILPSEIKLSDVLQRMQKIANNVLLV